MTIEQIFQTIAAIFISIGGAGGIFWALSSHFGNIWSERHIARFRNELDIIKESTLRYSGQQFQLYNDLWKSLCDLKSNADDLWSLANEENLRNFSQQLKTTIEKVEKSFLFIESSHYTSLLELLNEFKNYQDGKTMLVELYMNPRGTQRLSSEDEINRLIDRNRNNRERYNHLVQDIGNNLKNQLRGEN